MYEMRAITPRFTAIEDTVSHIAGMDPGATVTHLQMGDWLLAQRTQFPSLYYSRVGKVRGILIKEHGIFLDTVPTIGYRVETKGNEIRHCERKFVSGYRTMRKGVVNAQSIRLDNLDESARNTTIEKSNHMANLVGMLRSTSSMFA